MKGFSPFTLEGWYIFQLFEGNRHGVIKCRVRSEEVIVGNEECSKGDSTILSIESAGSSDVEFISTVKPLNELFKRSKLLGFRVKVLNTYDFFMREFWGTGLIKEMDAGWI